MNEFAWFCFGCLTGAVVVAVLVEALVVTLLIKTAE